MAIYESVEAEDVYVLTVHAVQGNEFIVAPSDSNDNMSLPKTRAECTEGIMPVSKGGTGITELHGNKLIASNTDGSFFEEVDINVSNLSGIKENIQDKLDQIRTFIVSIPSSTNWTNSTNKYLAEIPLEGIKSTDNPIVGLMTQSATLSGVDNENYAYSCIDSLTTKDNTIVLTCFEEIPKTSIKLILSCS